MTSTTPHIDPVAAVDHDRGSATTMRWVSLSMATMTTAVILFSALRGLARGYQPLGDNALIELRARDVFSADRPLLGSWSSASLSAGRDVNHLGPLLFDVLAVPVRLFGGPAGLALGAAAINIAALWVAVVAARRIGGDVVAAAVALSASLLAWSVGSEVLYDVWQPNILVLPFFAFLVLVWAISAGVGWAVPAAVAAGSLCLQVHLSYLFLVPALLLFGVLALGWCERAELVRRQGRWLIAGTVVLLVLWMQPLWEQLRGGSDGNLARVADSSGAQQEQLTGASLAARMLAEVVAVPPAFVRPGYETSIPLGASTGSTGTATDTMVSLPGAVGALLLLGVALIFVARAAARRGDRTVALGAAVAAVAALAGWASAAISPVDSLGLGVQPHKYRWMWSLGAFGASVLVAGVAGIVAEIRGRRVRSPLGVAAVVVVAVVSALSLPTYVPRAGPVEQRSAFAAAESLRQQVADADLRGVVLVDPDELFFAEPFTSAVMAELGRRGVSFTVASESMSRQVGPRRLETGRADVEVSFRYGADAELIPAGFTRIAYTPADETWPAFAVLTGPPDG